MKWIARISALVVALTMATALSLPARAQDLTNPNIQFGYIPPKSVKYQATLDRIKKRKVLEQLSEFLSPLKLPHVFYLVSAECGENSSNFYNPSTWAIVLCYEYIELMNRIAPEAGKPKQGFNRDEVIIGAFVASVLHETGHAVFDMVSVPVFGREEDAADQMAVFLALQFNKDVARTITRGRAYFWAVLGDPKEWSDFADEHGTSSQRFYNTMCLAYGGDPQTFKEFVDKGWLPKDRAANCADEYKQVYRAFEKTIYPFIDQAMMKKVQAEGLDEIDVRALTRLALVVR